MTLNALLESQYFLDFERIRDHIKSSDAENLPFELVTTKNQEALYQFLRLTTKEIEKRCRDAWIKMHYPAGTAIWGSEIDPISALIILKNQSDFSNERIMKARDSLAASIANHAIHADYSVLHLILTVTMIRCLPETTTICDFSQFLMSSKMDFVTAIIENEDHQKLILDRSSFEHILFLECSGEARDRVLSKILTQGLWLCPDLIQKHYGVFEKLFVVYNFATLLTKIAIPQDSSFIKDLEKQLAEIQIIVRCMVAHDIQKSKNEILQENNWAFDYFNVQKNPPENGTF